MDRVGVLARTVCADRGLSRVLESFVLDSRMDSNIVSLSLCIGDKFGNDPVALTNHQSWKKRDHPPTLRAAGFDAVEEHFCAPTFTIRLNFERINFLMYSTN